MWENILTAAMIAAQSFDVGSTHAAMKRGCEEAVWPTQNIYVIGGVKAISVTVLVWGMHKTKGKAKKIAVIGSVGAIASGLIGGIHNVGAYCGP